ncbi:hypothetical protein ABIE89_000277 [Bradyrhizobium niftali]
MVVYYSASLRAWPNSRESSADLSQVKSPFFKKSAASLLQAFLGNNRRLGS